MDEDEIKTKKKKVKMRTKIILGAILGFIVITAYKIISPYYILPHEIQELNENINMPFEFAAPIENFSFDQREWIRDEGEYTVAYYNQDGDRWGFEGFPDLGDPLKLTYCDTGNPEDMVFGFRIGDDINNVNSILKKHRYNLNKDDETYKYYKGKVSIIICLETYSSEPRLEEKNGDTIESISIRIKSTDWFHNGYYK